MSSEVQRCVNAAFSSISDARRWLSAARLAAESAPSEVVDRQLDALAEALDRAQSVAVVMQQGRLFGD